LFFLHLLFKNNNVNKTAKKPGSAPCPTLVIEYGTVGLHYFF